MHVTANKIATWAGTEQARSELPRVVRKLLHSHATITQISVPAGDSVASPGFDGALFSEKGSAWVPAGHSVWEISCRADVVGKAEEDYTKRVQRTDPTERSSRTFVALTARKWPSKNRWRDEKLRAGDWADVRAYDADDLEQWLEQSTPVELYLSELLGISGHGVQSIERYWNAWASQALPVITPEAILSGRQEEASLLVDNISHARSGRRGRVVSISADSTEEAVAFVAATLSRDPTFLNSAVVVTTESGWQYVETSADIAVAIAARPEIAQMPATRSDVVLLVPFASGDMAGHFNRGPAASEDSSIRLERPRHELFDDALVALGVGENDARRMSTNCGRSWTIFRRNNAVNPAIRRPGWLDLPSSRSLPPLCLLGAWSTASPDDTKVVERIAGREYEQIELDLAELANADDAPVIRIGSVWKAKSPLEMLQLLSGRITDGELNRFFESAIELLATPDPQLELPEGDRYAAAIYGKIRPVSSLLLSSLCDTLIKLSVRGTEVPSLAHRGIEARVASLINELLTPSDAIRWLSLSSHLPALAEAAPNAFLSALERSLEAESSAVRAVIDETGSSGVTGRCWHAGLLWALETLAWAPQRLTRTSLILAALTRTVVKGNWGNTPAASLLGIFRSWLPQTAATIEARVSALDTLVAREPSAAFELLDGLLRTGSDTASPAHRPRWRDDDAGVGGGVSTNERNETLRAAAQRILQMAEGNASRLAVLVDKMAVFDRHFAKRAFDLIRRFAHSSASDEERELVRRALRARIHWHRQYDDQGRRLDVKLARYEDVYAELEPKDLVVRHAWLFQSSWVDLPVRTKGTDVSERNAATEWRQGALQQIFQQLGWAGVLRLAQRAGSGWVVGQTVPEIAISREDLVQFVASHGEMLAESRDASLFLGGIANAVSRGKPGTFAQDVFAHIGASRWTANQKVRLLTLLVEQRDTWEVVESLGRSVSEAYWRECPGNIWFRDNADEFAYALEMLLKSRRARTAFAACYLDFEKVSSRTLVQIFNGVLNGDEANVPMKDPYYVKEAIKRLEGDSELDRRELVRLEFALLPLLGFEGEGTAASLMNALMTDPNLYCELVCLAFKASDGEARESSEGEKQAATNAWHLLHSCEVQPGTDSNGIDKFRFERFVAEARKLCADKKRAEVGDIIIGEILARGPAGVDGIFPHEAARSVLDAADAESIRQGFHTGCFNKRGVTVRGPFDGGQQERELANYYRQQATALSAAFPMLAAALDGLANTYERHGLNEDISAKLRSEER